MCVKKGAIDIEICFWNTDEIKFQRFFNKVKSYIISFCLFGSGSSWKKHN